MTIDWAAFLIVLASALGSAVLAVSLFSVGVRLLATPGPDAPAAAAVDPEDGATVPLAQRPLVATVVAWIAFASAAAVAIAGVAVIVH